MATHSSSILYFAISCRFTGLPFSEISKFGKSKFLEQGFQIGAVYTTFDRTKVLLLTYTKVQNPSFCEWNQGSQ